MRINTGNIKAFRKVDGEWQEIKCISDLIISIPSQDMEENFKKMAGSLNGFVEIQFDEVDAVAAAIATELRKKPNLEAWKANGKRKKPRIK